jgi:hypothetical protein
MDTRNDEVAGLFREFSCSKLTAMVKDVTGCLERLSDEQVWRRGAAHENAVGNLVLHLCGNMMQWILHGVAGEEDIRVRTAEFSAAGGVSGAELMALFRGVVEDAVEVIAHVPAERMTERITPQGRDVTVLGAIYQVVGHVQQHVGQIILLTKQMTGRDLDLTIPRPRT